MQFQNLPNSNPTLFKRINDKCIDTKFRGELDYQAFRGLFLNSNLFQRDVNQQNANDFVMADRANEHSAKNLGEKPFMPPSLEDIVEMFEFLDEDRSGMIKAQNFLSFLETAERIKIANVDLKKYREGQSNQPQSLGNKFGVMQKEVDELINTFDLTGDKLISPEEFFNIIMYAYS